MGNEVCFKVAFCGEYPDGSEVEEEDDERESGVGEVDVFEEVVVEGVLWCAFLPPLLKVEFVLVLD